jgi:hypothetical protein
MQPIEQLIEDHAAMETPKSILDYKGNPIDFATAVAIAGDEPRWAAPNERNLVRIENNPHFSYAIRNDPDGPEVVPLFEGGWALEDDATYVEYNDVYTITECIDELACGTPFIEACGDHVHYRGDDYDRDECSTCDDCGDLVPYDELDDDGYCPDCTRSGDDDASRIQEYHGHGLRDAVCVFTTPAPNLRKKHLVEYTVGFEVEKNHNGYREGDEIGEYPLFAYWETDGSCGIEGITHAYSLGSRHIFADHVRQSSRLLYLNADNRCGGHTSIKGPKMTRQNLRSYMGLFYALFRGRLKNTYCCGDARMTDPYSDKYYTVNKRGTDFVEIRVCSRITNATQLMNRYEAVGHLADAVHEGKSFERYMRSNALLLKRVYPDKEKRRTIYDLAHKFQNYIETGESAGVQRFLRTY